MFYYVLFLFVALGVKLLLAMATIYLLFPADGRCNHCDGDTLPLRLGAPGRLLSWLLLGQLQWRWCPQCRWEGWARAAGRPGPAHPARRSTAPSRG